MKMAPINGQSHEDEVRHRLHDLSTVEHDYGETREAVIDANLQPDGVNRVGEDFTDRANELRTYEQSQRKDCDDAGGDEGCFVARVDGSQLLWQSVVSPHCEKCPRHLDQCCFQGGDRRKHDREHDELSSRPAPHLLNEHAQDGSWIVRYLTVGEYLILRNRENLEKH